VVFLKRETYLIVLLLVLCSFVACSMAEEITELQAAPNPYPTQKVPVNGSVYVASFPTGATISVDGVQRGLTDQVVTNIPPGTHNLTLKKTGYQTKTVPVEIEAGGTVVLAPVTLSPGNATDGQKGSIYVSSIPSNATIYLDGVGKGVTDSLVTNVAAGNHTLTLTKSGYQTKTVHV
jgi:PEGA domain